jgi:drug/metabolite transporter (DMT)-like permease
VSALAGAPLAGVAALAASASWALSTTLMKGAIVRAGPRAMNLFRLCVAALLFWCATLGWDGGAAVRSATTEAGLQLLASGVIGLALGDVLLFTAMQRLGAQPAVALNQLSPIWSALLGFLLGSEALGARDLGGIALVLVGVLLVIFGRDGPNGAAGGALGESQRDRRTGVLCGVGSSLCNAAAGMITHHAINAVGVLPGSTLRMTGGAVALLLATILSGRAGVDLAPLRAVASQRRELLAVVIGTFLGVLLQQCAYAGLDASVALCLLSTTPLFLLPLAMAFLGERYRWFAWLGTLLATAGVPLLRME